MRRLVSLLAADVRFQWRYGFYGVYAALSLLYIAAVRLVPPSWRGTVRAITLYTDPVALGFFFIGAIVLFEKGERVLSSIAVSPVRAAEYTASKLVSLAFVSLASGLAIQAAGGGPVTLPFIAGIFLGSCFCTALGLAVASTAPTVNAFFVRSIPVGALALAIGPVTWLGFLPPALAWNPGSLMLFLIEPLGGRNPGALPALAAWLLPAFALAAYRSRLLFVGEALDGREGGIS